MYARGMLGNSSDYRKDSEMIGDHPTYYASLSNSHDMLHNRLGGGKKAVMPMPKKGSGAGVPDVLGLGLRDALSRLESAGYNVVFSGSGYVSGQSPVPGSKVAKGSKITLKLRE